MGSSRIDGGNGNESFGFGEASLSQVQDRQETGCGSGDLPESSAQAATRLVPRHSDDDRFVVATSVAFSASATTKVVTTSHQNLCGGLLGPSLSNRCPASRSLVMELVFFASVRLGWDMQRSGGDLLLGTSLLGGRNGTYCWN